MLEGLREKERETERLEREKERKRVKEDRSTLGSSVKTKLENKLQDR